MLVYIKGRWPEEPVPDGEPLWMYYEVATAKDVVTRMVEVYPNGDAIRNSIKLAERKGLDARDPEHRSLVHGAFLQTLPDGTDTISREEFDRVWDSATAKA